MTKQLIIVTSGDPSGVGPDICLDLFEYKLPINYHLIVLADINLLIKRAKLLNKSIPFYQMNDIDDYNQDKLNIYHIDCPNIDCIGNYDYRNASYVLTLLNTAINWCKNDLANIIVTAPISKEVICKAGIQFTGHTEYLRDVFNVPDVVMMLANDKFKIALLTTHIPLKDIPNHITEANLIKTVKIITDTFIYKFKQDNPHIGVCGLNPHAGENGYLGNEELLVINPTINKLRNMGYNISGSYPADTIFLHKNKFDVILAMYHDQGLPVLKYSGFDNGVNITLGLPIVRTSVDHGTAIDIAGTGLASSASLFSAIDLAIKYNG